MGIMPAAGYWLQTLRDRKVFEESKSLIELGPSAFLWPDKSLFRFLDKYFPDKQAQARFFEHLTLKDGEFHEVVANSFYELLGFDCYDTIDYGDGNATIKHNLNYDFPVTKQYDVLTDFGTIEHVFNIGEAFRTSHNLIRPGGIMVHFLPTFGGYYHCFYNISSVLWRSLIKANDYEVIDLLYCHDADRAHSHVEKHLYANFEDIREKEVRLQHTKFFLDYFSSLITGKQRTHSFVLAALRKTSDQPFVFPHQINKYPIDEKTQLWDVNIRQQYR